MKVLVSTTPMVLVQASKEVPMDITVQNLSAQDVYLSFEADPNAIGIKLIPDASYSNDYLTSPLIAYASASSDVRILTQRAVQKVQLVYSS